MNKTAAVLAALAAAGGETVDGRPSHPPLGYMSSGKKPIPEYQRRQRALDAAVRPRLLADSRVIRNKRLERRRGLPDGYVFVQRPEPRR